MPSIDLTLIHDKARFKDYHHDHADIDLFTEDQLNDEEWFKNFDIRDVPLEKLS